MPEAKCVLRQGGAAWVILTFHSLLVDDPRGKRALVSNLDCWCTLFSMPQTTDVQLVLNKMGVLLASIRRARGAFPPDFTGVGILDAQTSLPRLAVLDVLVETSLHSALHRLCHDALQEVPFDVQRQKAVRTCLRTRRKTTTKR